MFEGEVDPRVGESSIVEGQREGSQQLFAYHLKIHLTRRWWDIFFMGGFVSKFLHQIRVCWSALLGKFLPPVIVILSLCHFSTQCQNPPFCQRGLNCHLLPKWLPKACRAILLHHCIHLSTLRRTHPGRSGRRPPGRSVVRDPAVHVILSACGSAALLGSARTGLRKAADPAETDQTRRRRRSPLRRREVRSSGRARAG